MRLMPANLLLIQTDFKGHLLTQLSRNKTRSETYLSMSSGKDLDRCVKLKGNLWKEKPRRIDARLMNNAGSSTFNNNFITFSQDFVEIHYSV